MAAALEIPTLANGSSASATCLGTTQRKVQDNAYMISVSWTNEDIRMTTVDRHWNLSLLGVFDACLCHPMEDSVGAGGFLWQVAMEAGMAWQWPEVGFYVWTVSYICTSHLPYLTLAHDMALVPNDEDQPDLSWWNSEDTEITCTTLQSEVQMQCRTEEHYQHVI